MAKITLPSIASGYNPATINSNFQQIVSHLNDRVLYRLNVGGEPNQMINLLDMNSQRIINLPFPASVTEPVRKGDVEALSAPFVAEAQAAAAASAESAAESKAWSDVAAFQASLAGQYAGQAGYEVNRARALADIAAQHAANSRSYEEDSKEWSLESQSHALSSQGSAEDSANSAAIADSIATALAGGTIGFDAVAYDFGYISDPTTYFNRDFGFIV